jgi:hypothetical protein
LNIKIAAAVTMGVSIGNKVKVKVLHEIEGPLSEILDEIDPGTVHHCANSHSDTTRTP